MEWINDKPLEHTSHNGTTFKADRSDLLNGVDVSNKWECSESAKRSDYVEFVAWHALCVFKRLNGFRGYDCILFREASGEETDSGTQAKNKMFAAPYSTTRSRKNITGWKLTGACAVLWWIAACVYAVAEDWNTAITLVFAAAGWTGWAHEERKNTEATS